MDIKRIPQLKGPHGPDDIYPSMTKSKAVGDFLNSLVDTEQWNRSKSEREQVLFALTSCKENGYPVSQYELARFFGIERSTVQYHIERSFNTFENIPRPFGRPSLLEDQEKAQLIAWISDTFNNRYPATYQTIREFIDDRFGKQISLDTIRHIVHQAEELKVVTGVPMENERVFCNPQRIDKYFEELESALEFGIPPQFIINIDESGYQDWVDSRNVQCIVPAHYAKEIVKMPRDRTSKRATMLAGICADGSTIRPMVVITRETIEKELLDLGYICDKVIYGRSETGFMNQELFLSWTRTSFIPEMKEKRARYSYDGPILLIMDGYGVHDCDQFREILSEENIHPILFAPHSSDQTQFLDLLIFALQKSEMQQMRIRNELNWQTKQVIKILDSWQRVTVPRNIIAAFRRGGLIVQWDQDQGKLIASVDRSHATAVRHFDLEEHPETHDKKRIRIW